MFEESEPLSTPDGHKVPIIRQGSPLSLRPTLAPFNRVEFEAVRNTFHNTKAQGTLEAPTFRTPFYFILINGSSRETL